MVFDQGIGDIFVGRVAGNVATTEQIGSMEFATKLAGSKLVMVLGHESCGAVKGACDGAKLGNLTALLDHIQPAIQAVDGFPNDQRNSKNKDYVAAGAPRSGSQGPDQDRRRHLRPARRQRDADQLNRAPRPAARPVFGPRTAPVRGLLRWGRLAQAAPTAPPGFDAICPSRHTHRPSEIPAHQSHGNEPGAGRGDTCCTPVPFFRSR